MNFFAHIVVQNVILSFKTLNKMIQVVKLYLFCYIKEIIRQNNRFLMNTKKLLLRLRYKKSSLKKQKSHCFCETLMPKLTAIITKLNDQFKENRLKL